MGPAQMMQTLFHHGDETDSFTEYNLASEIPFVSPAATFADGIGQPHCAGSK